MISGIIGTIWGFGVIFPFILFDTEDKKYPFVIWVFLSLIWIIPIFTGIPVEDSVGQYKGYVTAVEQNGAIFKGWNVHLKTELESSDADMACIDRENKKLISALQKAQEEKKNVVLEYRGVWQYPIGVCPGKDWMIINIK